MDENGQGPDKNEPKAIVEWDEISGIFSVNRVRDVVDQRRDEIAQDAYSAVAYQELCGRRAQTRNDFRTWAEQIPFLARTLKVDSIPAMTPQQIATEEQNRVDRKAERVARRHKGDMLMQAVHNYVQTALAPLRDATQVELEEKAKYLAGKLRRIFLKKDFSGAVKFFQEHKKDFPYPYEAEVFGDLVYEECRIFLRMISEEALHDLLPEALDAVAQMTKLEREDMYFLRENFQGEEEKKVFEDKLCEAMLQHPAIYIRMRQTFMDLGFIDGPRMDAHPKIRAAMMKVLTELVQKYPDLYYSFLRQLHDAGVVLGEDIHQSHEMDEAIEKGLVKAMKVGPIAYILLRDRMNKRLLIDDVEYNFNEKVQEASVQHFDDWYGEKSRSFEPFVQFCRKHGVVVPAAFIELLKGEVSWVKKLGRMFKDNLVNVNVQYFEDFLADSSDFDEYFLQQERYRMAEIFKAFLEKYPMYRRGK